MLKVKNVVGSYPAYDVINNEDENGVIKLKAGDNLIKKNHLTKFKINSVMSYALEYNECPIKAYERAIELKQEVYFIFGLGSCLTSHKQKRKEYIEIYAGAKVYFQGKNFIVKKANNDNFNLEEIK